MKSFYLKWKQRNIWHTLFTCNIFVANISFICPRIKMKTAWRKINNRDNISSKNASTFCHSFRINYSIHIGREFSVNIILYRVQIMTWAIFREISVVSLGFEYRYYFVWFMFNVLINVPRIVFINYLMDRALASVGFC